VLLLWRDKLGQISLAVTTLFWGAGATLQFIVHQVGGSALGLDLSTNPPAAGRGGHWHRRGAIARQSSSRCANRCAVLPLGIAMGAIVLVMNFVTDMWMACRLMIAVGALAGFFVVPMNALLQHRGHILMGAGHSIAVQNFNENISILVMLGLYALLVLHLRGDRPVRRLRQPGHAAGRLLAPPQHATARRGAGAAARRGEERQRAPLTFPPAPFLGKGVTGILYAPCFTLQLAWDGPAPAA
jgi:hypothetical protein